MKKINVQKIVQGLHTALVTPFTLDNQIDEEGLSCLIQRQVEAAVDGILLLGTTGESPTISKEEKIRLLSIGRRQIPHNCLFMVGTGNYSTEETIENTKLAKDLGADAALVVVPYYNRPTQEGLYLHFKAIATSCSLPIVIYNVPTRTGQNLLPETLARLAEIPSIIGLKDCSGNISQMSESIALTMEMRDDFSIMSGDDSAALALMSMGGAGLISVASNLLPTEMKEFIDLLSDGNFSEARKNHHYLMPLFKALFVETNPIPIKHALSLCGLPSGLCRLPLTNLSPVHKNAFPKILELYYKTNISLCS